MRFLLLAILLFAAAPLPAKNYTNKELAQMIAAKAKQQQEILDQTLKRLQESTESVNTLGNELLEAQAQIAKVDKERNDWHTYADDQHNKWMNAEKRVSDEKVKTLRCYLIIGAMALVMVGYAIAKFYFRLPI